MCEVIERFLDVKVVSFISDDIFLFRATDFHYLALKVREPGL